MSKTAKESVLLLSLFLIAAMVQFFAQSLPMALCFYFLPTLYSAYYFGRRHATLTAFACVFLVVLLDFLNNLMPAHRVLVLPGERLFNFAIWAGVLVVVGYVMGTLYERKEAMTADIRESFGGLLLVLQHFMANEKLGVGENQRVVQASTRMAEAMGLGSDRVELLRSAVLLRDLSKLGITNDILYKAADMSRDEVVASFRKATQGRCAHPSRRKFSAAGDSDHRGAADFARARSALGQRSDRGAHSGRGGCLSEIDQWRQRQSYVAGPGRAGDYCRIGPEVSMPALSRPLHKAMGVEAKAAGA